MSPQSGPDGSRRLPAPGNAQSHRFARLDHLQAGTTYYWSVQAVDGAFAGSAFATEGSFTFNVAGVGDAASTAAMTLRAAPNPFTGPTTIRYALPIGQSVQLGIYDASGRRVRTLARGTQAAGRYTVGWDGLDDHGWRVPGGVYFARLQGPRNPVSQRLVLMR